MPNSGPPDPPMPKLAELNENAAEAELVVSDIGAASVEGNTVGLGPGLLSKSMGPTGAIITLRVGAAFTGANRGEVGGCTPGDAVAAGGAVGGGVLG